MSSLDPIFSEPCSATAPGRVDRRASVRGQIALQQVVDGRLFAGELRDVSIAGIRLASNDPLTIGSRVHAMITFDEGLDPLTLHAEVAWCRRLDEGDDSYPFHNGLRFVELVEPQIEALHRFVDRTIWKILTGLGETPLLEDLNDLERMSLSTVCLHYDLEPGHTLSGRDVDSGIVLLSRGAAEYTERSRNGAMLRSRRLRRGAVCGALPTRSAPITRAELSATERSTVVIIPAEGFWHLWEHQPSIALSLLHGYGRRLEDQLRKQPATADAGPPDATNP